MYRENESAPFVHYRFTFLRVLRELSSALVVLLINIPLSLSLDYHSHLYLLHALSESVGGFA